MALRLTINRDDPDYLYATVQVSDEHATFSTSIYVGHAAMRNTAAALQEFGRHAPGALFDFDFAFGRFGSEYAGGALHVQLQVQTLGVINMTMRVESQVRPFGQLRVSSGATLYATTSFGQLDDFVRAMQAISDGFCDEAQL